MNIKIIHRHNNAVLFEGNYDSIKQAVEAAHKEGANLTEADLTGANLTGADLTGANLYRADLTEAGLTGVKFKPGWKIVKNEVQS